MNSMESRCNDVMESLKALGLAMNEVVLGLIKIAFLLTEWSGPI